MLTIGDFARYAGMSVRMLRHYDAIGLLLPSYVDPSSGYRLYEPALLDRANAIVALRGLGFSLAEVGTLLEGSLTAPGIRAMLDQRRRELETQIGADLARLAEVERRLLLIEGESTMELEYAEKPLPALTLSQIRRHVSDHEEIMGTVGPMFGELFERLAEAGIEPSHPAIAWYSGDESGTELAAAFEVERVPGTEPGHLDAAPRAVTAIYRGSVVYIGEAWQALAAYVKDQGLEFAGPCREVYLHTEPDNPDSWVTELQQPVA
jgi:DNA-binding transcriptional MerR regulator